MKHDIIVPPYKEVYHAVRRAYGAEVGEVWGRMASADCFGHGTEKDVPLLRPKFKVPAQFAALKRERVRASDASPYDWIIQGVWTMRLMRKTLPRNLMVCLDAKHIFAIPPDERRKSEPAYWGESRLYNIQLSRKRTACHRLADLVAKAGTCGRPDRAYTLDCVNAWAGLESTVDAEWSEVLGKHPRTLRRWRKGRGTFSPGIECALREWFHYAHDILDGPFHDAGLTMVRLTSPACYTVHNNSYKASA